MTENNHEITTVGEFIETIKDEGIDISPDTVKEMMNMNYSDLVNYYQENYKSPDDKEYPKK